jgi:hypothetical protein
MPSLTHKILFCLLCILTSGCTTPQRSISWDDSEKASQELLVLLDSRKKSAQEEAARSLGQHLTQPGVTQALLQKATNAEPSLRIAALYSLTEAEPSVFLPAVETALTSINDSLRMELPSILLVHASKIEPTEWITTNSVHDPWHGPPGTRILYSSSSISIDSRRISSVAPFLERLAKDKHERIRNGAIDLMARSADPNLVKHAIDAAKHDPSPFVRAETINTLGQMLNKSKLDKHLNRSVIKLEEADYAKLVEGLSRVHISCHDHYDLMNILTPELELQVLTSLMEIAESEKTTYTYIIKDRSVLGFKRTQRITRYLPAMAVSGAGSAAYWNMPALQEFLERKAKDTDPRISEAAQDMLNRKSFIEQRDLPTIWVKNN